MPRSCLGFHHAFIGSLGRSIVRQRGRHGKDEGLMEVGKDEEMMSEEVGTAEDVPDAIELRSISA